MDTSFAPESLEMTAEAEALPENDGGGGDLPVRASTIVFGSCNSQHYEQPFWKILKDRNPTAFVWAGDAIYADDARKEHWSSMEEEEEEENGEGASVASLGNDQKARPRMAYATPEDLRRVYQWQLRVEDYQSLLEETDASGQRLSVFGTIDDHDYGIDNGDRTFPYRRENGMEFVRFLGLQPESSAMARRVAQGMGVYGVQVYDFSSRGRRLLTDTEAGLDPDVVSEAAFRERFHEEEHDSEDNNNNQRVAVFVLDVRSNKTPWTREVPDRFSPDPEGDFLGPDQWEWFETALRRSTARVNLVVSGIQVHAPMFYDMNRPENWSSFPKAQHRLYQNLLQPNVRSPIMISGDVHMAQIRRKDCRQETGTGEDSTSIVRPLFEVTSSGMTHAWGSKDGFCGRPNMGWVCRCYPCQLLVKAVMTYAHFVSPWTALVQTDAGDGLLWGRKVQTQYSLDRNIAEFEFDWIQNSVTVRLIGDEGQTLLRQDWPMDQLNGGTETTVRTDTMLRNEDFDIGQHLLESSLKTTLPKGHSDYICVNYRGNINRLHFAFSLVSTFGVFMIGSFSPFILAVVILKITLGRRKSKTKCPGWREKSTITTVNRLKKD